MDDLLVPTRRSQEGRPRSSQQPTTRSHAARLSGHFKPTFTSACCSRISPSQWLTTARSLHARLRKALEGIPIAPCKAIRSLQVDHQKQFSSLNHIPRLDGADLHRFFTRVCENLSKAFFPHEDCFPNPTSALHIEGMSSTWRDPALRDLFSFSPSNSHHHPITIAL